MGELSKSLRHRILIWGLLIVVMFLVVGCQGKSNEQIEEFREITVYFTDDEANYLVPEKRKIANDEDMKNLSKNIIEELAKSSDNKLQSTIPSGVKLLSTKFDDGIITLNFSREIIMNHSGGSSAELLTVYSIVNSLTEIEEIDAVQILVEGSKLESLKGHCYIFDPLDRDDTLIK